MMRFRLIRGLLIAGVVLGFTHGFMSLRHHRHERWQRWHDAEHARGDCRRDAPPPTAPPAAPAPR